MKSLLFWFFLTPFSVLSVLQCNFRIFFSWWDLYLEFKKERLPKFPKNVGR
jgi:hypothetical protein